MRALSEATFARVAVLLTLSMVGACAVSTPRNVTEISLATHEKDAALYDDIHDIIVQHYGRYDNEFLQGMAQRLGEQLAVRNNMNDLVVRVTVLDSPLFNAFSHPPGHIYVTRGLLAYLNSEAESASIIAHELAHLVHHDASRHTRPVAESADSMIAGPFAFAVINDQALREAMLPLIATFSHGYGRELEIDAIGFSAEVVARAGYDPEEMLELLKALKRHEEGARRIAHAESKTPSVYHGIVAFDPATDARIGQLVASAVAFRTDPVYYIVPDSFVAALDELIIGDRVDYGIERDGKLYHKNMGITLAIPKAWSTRGLADGVVLYPSDEKVFMAAFSTEADLDQPLAAFMKSYFELDNLDGFKSATFSGREALVGEARLNTIFGERSAVISALYVGENAVVFAAIADDEQHWTKNHKLITQTLQSIRPWSEADEKFLKPLQLKPVTVPDGKSLGELYKASKDSLGIDHIRLLNRLYPDGEPKPGQTIKLLH